MIEDIRLGGAMSKTIVEFKDVVRHMEAVMLFYMQSAILTLK